MAPARSAIAPRRVARAIRGARRRVARYLAAHPTAEFSPFLAVPGFRRAVTEAMTAHPGLPPSVFARVAAWGSTPGSLALDPHRLATTLGRLAHLVSGEGTIRVRVVR